MNLYSVDFIGHYPTGTAMVVVAKDQQQAFDLALAKLQHEGLWQESTIDNQNNHAKNFTINNVEELDTTEAKAHMLCDGNY